MNPREKPGRAHALLREFKGQAYVYGSGVLDQAGPLVAQVGGRAALVRSTYRGSDDLVRVVRGSVEKAGVTVAGEVAGAQPNAPREDLQRITESLCGLEYDVLVVLGGGSTIDAAKAAEVLRILGGEIDDYFGTDQVTEAMERKGKTLTPIVAIQTASSSAACFSCSVTCR